MDHVLRHDITEGRMKGQPTRGKRRLEMLRDLTQDDVCAAVRRAAEKEEEMEIQWNDVSNLQLKTRKNIYNYLNIYYSN